MRSDFGENNPGNGDGGLRVVMPVHNAESFLDEALESVLNDLPAGGEVVVVDDGSSDRSPEILARYADDRRVAVIRNDTATGVSRALNRAITYGECPEFVSVAEHDDVVLPGRFAAHVRALETDPQLGAVSGEGRYLGPTGRVAGRVAVGPKNSDEFRRMKEQGREILIPHPAITYRRDAVVGVGLYDETFDAAQDLEIVNRLVYEGGWEVRLLAGPHVLYRIHDESMSFAHIASQRMMTRYIVYRNNAQLNDLPYEGYSRWCELNQPDRRTKVRWWRKDTGALCYRKAGLAWLNRRPFSFLGNLAEASVLHPKWVLMKIGVAMGR